MELGDLQVAVDRVPIAGVVFRAGAPEDTAVTGLEQVAVGVNDHPALVGMRHAIVSCARASQRLGLGARTQRCIDAEDRLPIASNVNEIGVVRIGGEWEKERVPNSQTSCRVPARLRRRCLTGTIQSNRSGHWSRC